MNIPFLRLLIEQRETTPPFSEGLILQRTRPEPNSLLSIRHCRSRTQPLFRFFFSLAFTWFLICPILSVTADPLDNHPSVSASNQSQDQAASLPSGQTRSEQLDLDFLNLPAFDPIQLSHERETLKVGDVLEFKLDGSQIVDHLKDQKSNLKPLEGLLLEEAPSETNLQEQGWEIHSISKTQDISKDGAPSGASKDYYFEAIPLKPGKVTLPSLALKTKDGTKIGRTNPLSFEIASAIAANDPQPDQPEVLEPPVGLAFPIWIIAVAGAIIILIIIGFIYGILKWQKNKFGQKASPIERYRSEDEIALQDLFELEQKKWIQSGEFKIYYFRLSEILKVYLGNRYRFDGAESTTQEILSFLEKGQLVSDELLDRLETLFSQLDQVKFTDFIPAPSEGLALMVEAREWVQITRKAPAILDQAGVAQNASQ